MQLKDAMIEWAREYRERLEFQAADPRTDSGVKLVIPGRIALLEEMERAVRTFSSMEEDLHRPSVDPMIDDRGEFDYP